MNRTVLETNQHGDSGMAMSTAANRISFTFNLTGPSLAIDTACSSFLTALHFACTSIKQGIGISNEDHECLFLDLSQFLIHIVGKGLGGTVFGPF